MLPAQSRRFMEILRDKRRLSMPEVLKTFGLARAKAVGGIIEPVNRMAGEYGIDKAFESSSTETGERLWLWPGTADEDTEASAVPAPSPARTIRSTRPTPAAVVSESTGDSAGRPGVRVRRRTAP